MLKIFNLIILFISFLTFTSCNGQDCNTIQNDFDSYKSALKTIKSSNFQISENCDTSKSSWIYNAEYFSCNKKTGFLLIKTKSKTYIHKEVPIEKWNEFKKGESFGKYYNKNIKNRFQLIL